ncbi:MAG: helicase-related protein [Candidatus Helarchaeota archaeon]
MEEKEKSELKKLIPLIIDNRFKEILPGLEKFIQECKTMGLVINDIFNNSDINRIRICTGFFSPHVWKLVGKSFEKLPISTDEPAFELLLGSEVKERSKKDFQAWFNEQIRKELNEFELDIELQRHIRSLISFLERDDVYVGTQKRPFVHGKMYCFEEVAIVGSSNFTYHGFTSNTELNIPVFDKKQVMALSYWFDYHFKKANTSYKEVLIEALKNCKLGTTEWSPFNVYMKILYEAYKPTLSFEELATDIEIKLTVYQQEGVQRLIQAINDFGGAMLADSVGLGKSYQALEVIRHLQATQGKRQALIIVPAQLRHNWENMVATSDIWAQVYSMEKLAKNLPKKKKFDIIAIDESHNFRNPNTKRFKKLELLLAKNPDASVLLLTATPINTSLKDLLSQMLIIAKSTINYKPFYNIGIFDLKNYFKAVENKEEDIGKLRDHLIISRSRREVRLRQKLFEIDLTIGGQPLRFPERHLASIDYTITNPSLSGMSSLDFYQKVVDLLDKLEFPYYNLEKFNIDEIDKSAHQLGANLVSIMKTLLLKRLESSIIAFEKSLENQLTLNNLFNEAIQQKLFLKSSRIRKIFEDIQAELQDTGEDPIEAFCKAIKTPKQIAKYVEDDDLTISYDQSKIEKEIENDKMILRQIENVVKLVQKHEDQKLNALFKKIEELGDKKILVFSYFKDTVNYIFEKLNKKYPENAEKYEKITGEIPHDTRNKIVRRFAPLSNPSTEEEEEEIRPDQEIQILISTDALSEGQNLQDAPICINYDLHWNPVRIIQRIGRIDRLKSPNKDVWIYNFFPEQGLETLLSLVSRLVDRLRLINQTLELDGAVLTGDELGRKTEQITRLKEGDITILDELESEIELLSDEGVRDLLIKEIFEKGDKFFKKIPIGVHSGMISKEHAGVAVIIRAFRRGVPSFFWGFEPDEPEKYEEWLKNGIVTTKALVQKIISCEKNEPRYLIESENINGDLFKRVLNIAKKLKELLWASDIVRKIDDKLPPGNKIYLEHIKLAEKIARNLPIKLPNTSTVKDFLKLRRMDIIAAELDELPKQFKNAIEEYKKVKKASKLIDKKASEEKFVNSAKEFILKLTEYINTNELLGEENSRKGGIRSKFELIGFLRIYGEKAKNN